MAYTVVVIREGSPIGPVGTETDCGLDRALALEKAGWVKLLPEDDQRFLELAEMLCTQPWDTFGDEDDEDDEEKEE